MSVHTPTTSTTSGARRSITASSSVSWNPEKVRLRTTVPRSANSWSSGITSSSPEPSTQCGGNMSNSGSSGVCVSTRKTSATPSASAPR